ncbi:hypothetical protein QBC34DRAFT_51846 [Podospora aff. communis PSN243]|uniref:Uncharacterized protein n=1 Tax=Podospora aff. communis PSN243 TaxID=3040156 RepID=A0AAV9GYT4_9PEZI|nr:hypothetical protein QBC34DRAFT_51846 [Podospora aff. communis PSN243]
MRPNASGVVLLLSSLSLVQAAAHRRDAILGRILGARADGDVEKRQAAPETVTVLQTVTVGAAGGGAEVNNTVTVTAAASTVTITACPSPGLANGAADGASASSVSVPNAGAVGAAPGAAQPGTQGTPSGGIGVVIVEIPESARKTTGNGAVATPPPAASAPPAVAPSAGAPVVQNPAASNLAPLPSAGAPAAGSSLAPLPGASAGASSLAPLPGAASSLAPLPGAASSTLAALPSSSLAALPSAGSSAALPTPPALAPLPSVAAPAAPLQSTVDLGNVQIPGGVVGGAAPVAGPDGAFGGEVGAVPLNGAAPGSPAQAVNDPSVTVAPDVAAGAQLVNIDLSNVSLNSQLNLGNLVQATAAAVPI